MATDAPLQETLFLGAATQLRTRRVVTPATAAATAAAAAVKRLSYQVV